MQSSKLGNSINVTGNKFTDIQSAINGASNGDVIYLKSLAYWGYGKDIYINKAVTIVGSYGSSNERVALNGMGSSRIFFVDSKNVNISNILFTNGYVKGDGGAIRWKGNNGVLSNCIFYSNTAYYVRDNTGYYNGRGGAVYYETGNNLLIDNCTFEKNAGFVGGGIRANGKDVTVSNCIFNENKILRDGNYGEDGGAINFPYTKYHIYNSTFVNNSAYTYGGAISCMGSGDMADCRFINNSASIGGAIRSYCNNNLISSSYFEGNNASEGGAIYIEPSGVGGTVFNSTFVKNTANTGGAITVLGKKAVVDNCSFTANIANDMGGAIHLWGADNSRINNCRFDSDLSLSMGGAIHWYALNGVISNCIFEKNQAVLGCAVNCWNDLKSDEFLIVNSTFKRNQPFLSSNSCGGAIYVQDIGRNIIIANSDFEHNSAVEGGAIYIQDGLKSIENSTFKFNKANALKLAISKDKETIKCVLTGNENYMNAIYATGDVGFRNVTYWDGDFVSSDSPVCSNLEAGIAIQCICTDGNGNGISIKKITNGRGEVIFDEFRTLPNGHYSRIISMPANDYYTSLIYSVSDLDISVYEENTLAIDLKDIAYGQCPIANITANRTGNYTIYISNSSYKVTFSDDDVEMGRAFGQNVSINDEDAERGYKLISLPLLLDAKDGYGAYIQLSANDRNYASLMYIHNMTSFNVLKAESSIDANDTVSLEGSPAEIAYNVENGTLTLVSIEKEGLLLENGTDYNFTVSPNNVIIMGLDIGNYSINLTTIVDGNHKSCNKEVLLRIIYPTAIEVQESFAIEEGESSLIGAALSPQEAGSLRYISNDESIVKVDSKGNLTAVAEGNTTVLVIFDGNDDYASSNATVKVTVYSESMPTSIKVNGSFELYEDESTNLGAVLDPANAGSLTYKSSNESIVKVDNNGRITGVRKGKANITISFDGNEKFLASNATILVTVYPLVDLSIVKVANVSGDVYLGDKIKFVITLSNKGPSNATGVYVRESLNSNLVLVSNSTTKGSYDGSIWTIGNLNKGKTASLTIIANLSSVGDIDNEAIANSSEEDSNYANNIARIKTIKALPIVDLNINISSNKKSLNVGDTFTYTINLVNSGPSKATNIWADEHLSPLLELVNANASFGNYDNFSGIWSVGDLNPNNPVSLSLTVRALSAGKIENIVNAYSNEHDSNESNNNFTLSINCAKINTRLNASDMTAMYDETKYLLVSLTDINKKAIVGEIISVEFDGINNYTTDSNGQVKIPTKSLVPDTYNLTVRFEGNEMYNPSNASVSVIVKRANTSFNYTNMNTLAFDSKIEGRVGDYFRFQLLDNDKNPIAGRQVFIGFNGVKYNRTTNETGEASLQINLKYANHYTFAIAFLGDDYYGGDFQVALINVTEQTPVLTAGPKTYKSSAKTKALAATLKSSRGQAIEGKRITFTINGKVYSGNTNSDGIATVNVSLSKKGSYSFTVQYGGDSTYKKVTKSSKLTIK